MSAGVLDCDGVRGLTHVGRSCCETCHDAEWFQGVELWNDRRARVCCTVYVALLDRGGVRRLEDTDDPRTEDR